MAGRDAATRPGALRSARHVPRPRLTRLLDEAAGQAIVVNAPAGYGKTMLAREWLEGKPRVAWLQASAAAADLAAFSAGLAAAAADVVPVDVERVRHRARIADTPEEAARPLAELLADELHEWPADGWLAVDDYHLVGGSTPIEEFVDWLLVLAPIRLLVTTRRRPGWASARRILYGEILELTRDDLAMTADEAAEVLTDRSSAEVAALLERAQGWPAVIGLAGLSASLPARRPRISDALFRYFAEEVFRREPPDVQRFMLAAAVPPTVDARAAREVLDEADPEPALARLESEGLLHGAADGLRFHPLVRDFLLRTLQAQDEQLAAELAERAIADARARGRAEDAFELACESGRKDLAAAVAADAVGELLAAGRVETVERWLAACEPLDAPQLVLARAEVSIRRGEVFNALALAHDLARRLPPDDPHASAAWYLTGRGFHLLSEDERALECHLKAREAARTRDDSANALWGATVLAAQLESPALDAVVADLDTLALEDAEARFDLAVSRVFVASRRGSLAGVWASVEPLVALVEEAPNISERTSFLAAAAYLNVSRASYGTAHVLITRALEIADRFRLGRAKRAFCLCQRVAADIGLRRFADAERTLGELADVAIDQTQVLLAEQRILRMKLALACRRFPELLDADPPVRAPRASLGEHVGLVAIAAAANGDAARATAAADRAEELTGSVEARHYARFARAIAAHAAGRARGHTADAVVEAVFDAAAAEVLDAFVIAYRAYPPLLETVARDPELVALVRDAVVAANDQTLARRAGITRRDGANATRGALTPRETEVLELIAQGLPNAEIARRLYISEKTAKVHVYHIFEKLGVETRVQAVLASRDLLAS